MVCNPFVSVKTWDQVWILELAPGTGRFSSLTKCFLWLWWFEDRSVLTTQIQRLSLLPVFSIYMPQNITITEEISKYDTGIRIFWCMIVWQRYDPFLCKHCQPWTDGAWQGLEQGIAGRAMCCPLLGTDCGHTSAAQQQQENRAGGWSPDITDHGKTPKDKIFPKF